MDDIYQIAKKLADVSDTPLLDARLLSESASSAEELALFIQRRQNHEPVSKIIGRRGFWKSDFITTLDVLDPRPDSETMIETVLHTCSDTVQPYRILDIGTGSGCLLFSLLDEYPQAFGIGVDISEKALAVAKMNLGHRRAELKKMDLMHPFPNDIGLFDIIISNPPYIPTSDIEDLSPDVRLYDPMLALDGGPDGLNAYRALAKHIPEVLKPTGFVFLEVGIHQAESVVDLFKLAGFSHVSTQPDLGGIPRIIVFKKEV